ncbi:MAG: lysophospholipid acyltransferase family protein [Candidatus Neomarinimicrobiota bacterium]
MNYFHRLTYRCLLLFSTWLSRLSDKSRDKLAIHLAGFVYNWIPLRQTVALRNLQRAFPDRPARWYSDTLRQSYQFFLRLMLLFFSMRKKYPSLKITVTGRDHLDRAAAQGKGTIMVTGHCGAWEVYAAWTGYNGYPVVPVAVRQRNRGADRFFRELRGAAGIEPIYRKTSLDSMYQALADGKLLTLGSDQDARSHGVFVNFFNIPSSTPKGTALFHLNTGAPIVFGICYQAGDEYFLDFEPVPVHAGDGVREITQRYTSMLEKYIKRYPEQYFWWHRRWKTKPTEQHG